MKVRMDKIYRMRTYISFRRLFLLLAPALFIVCLLIPNLVAAQDTEYEEILVSVNVQGMGTIEMPAVINDKVLYLPVLDIFDFLKIKNEATQNLDTVRGFFITQDNNYIIDKANNIIWLKEKPTQLQPEDIIKTETGLYLKTDYLGSVFDLPSVFNFRALLVNMSSKTELPVMREARLEAIRGNVQRLKGEIIADTTLKRINPIFHFGMTDWSVISSQTNNLNDTRLNLGLGGIVAGGELNASLNYSTSLPFKEKQQFYMWRYVDNDARAVKQVMAGKIPTATVSSLFSPVLGVQVTNTPTIAKRTFGSYVLSNITEPNWVVELYVNNVLVDYVKADATGFFTFNVPLVYGNSAIKLRYYGPFGEERTKEENISVPFNFISPGKIEYTAAAGVVEDDSLSRLGKGGVSYGLSKRITIGTGIEYLSSVTSGNTMPYLNTSIRLGKGVLVFGEHNYSVRTKAGLFYRTVNNWQFEVNYTLYQKGQKAINNNALEERRFVASVPIRGRRFSMFSMATLNQTILPITSYTTGEWMLSGTFRRMDGRISTIGIFTEGLKPLVYSNFTLAFRLPKGYIFTPEAQYQYTLNEFISIKGILEKRVLRYGYIGLSFEENFKSKLRNIGLQLRYDFQFAQVGFTGRFLNNKFSFLEAARGSVMYDRKSNYAGINNSTSIGRSGIVLLPYLDMNGNNHRDPNEPKVSGLKFRISSGRVQPESKDTTIRVLGLEPYNNYYIELNRLSFDNIAWQMRKKTLKVFAEPNMFRLIEIPIAVVGEVTGTVNLIKDGLERGQGQILVNIYKGDTLISKTLSEPDGYFSYMGLSPGTYTAQIDTAQLRKINMTASPAVPFSIATTKDGDVVEGIDFTLRSRFDTMQVKTINEEVIDNPAQPAKKPTTPVIKKKPKQPVKKPGAVPIKRKASNYKPFPSPMAGSRPPKNNLHPKPVAKPQKPASIAPAKAAKVIKKANDVKPKIQRVASPPEMPGKPLQADSTMVIDIQPPKAKVDTIGSQAIADSTGFDSTDNVFTNPVNTLSADSVNTVTPLKNKGKPTIVDRIRKLFYLRKTNDKEN